MRALLDTHAFLWFILDDPQLTPVAKALIEDPATEVLVSPASYWEVAIKVQLGKYALPIPFRQFMDTHIAANAFVVLPVEVRHVEPLTTLPLHHRDPFDRMLAAHSLTAGLPLCTKDTTLLENLDRAFWD